MTDETYSPKEIVSILSQRHSAGSLAGAVAAFWPTIKQALLDYEKTTNGAKVKPIPSGD